VFVCLYINIYRENSAEQLVYQQLLQKRSPKSNVHHPLEPTATGTTITMPHPLTMNPPPPPPPPFILSPCLLIRSPPSRCPLVLSKSEEAAHWCEELRQQHTERASIVPWEGLMNQLEEEETSFSVQTIGL
jgi:hypothetical protein